MRLERRFPLKDLLNIRVVDTRDNQPLGYIADISAGGFRLTSEDSMAPESCFTAQLEIPVRTGHHRTLELQVQCKWSRVESRLKRYNLGFQLTEPSEGFQQLLIEIRTSLKLKRRKPV